VDSELAEPTELSLRNGTLGLASGWRPHLMSLLSLQLSAFISDNLDSPSDLMKAAVILRTILEVFSKKSSGSEMRLFSAGDLSLSPSLTPLPPGVNHAVHLSFQSDKSFCGLAALYRLSLTLLSRAVQGIPYSLLELREGSHAASLRVDIAEFSSEVRPASARSAPDSTRPVCSLSNSSAGISIPTPPCKTFLLLRPSFPRDSLVQRK
jgi:hypothetical protein